MKKLTAILAGFVMMGTAGMANAAPGKGGFQTKGQIANQVSRNVRGATQSTVVGYTKSHKQAYVRTEGTRNGTKFVETRRVSARTGSIQSKGSNLLPTANQLAALQGRNGAKGGESGDVAYGVRAAKNAMGRGGNIKVIKTNAGFNPPRAKEARAVGVTKSGAIQFNKIQKNSSGPNTRSISSARTLIY